ncbi:hypothetical protein CJF31_00002650 [Rutstroemia sp. NJR-2017a BVV2]|nr:hypothetical protein CJF31_00002650 [Rutstroemia sp. NJR-2017a BVV2]
MINNHGHRIHFRTPHTHHSKYSAPDDHPPGGGGGGGGGGTQPPPGHPHIPTTWKVAIGVNAFVLLITAAILGMLVWILRKEYKKRRLQGEGFVGAKDGFGRRMKSARRNRGNSLGTGRQRAWSYDPIREEEEEGEAAGVVLKGLREGSQGQEMGESVGVGEDGRERMPLGLGMGLDKGKGRAGNGMGKAKRAWGGRHVRFKSWSGDPSEDPRDKVGVVAGSSGKEERVLELRSSDGPVDVQTP